MSLATIRTLYIQASRGCHDALWPTSYSTSWVSNRKHNCTSDDGGGGGKRYCIITILYVSVIYVSVIPSPLPQALALSASKPPCSRSLAGSLWHHLILSFSRFSFSLSPLSFSLSLSLSFIHSPPSASGLHSVSPLHPLFLSFLSSFPLFCISSLLFLLLLICCCLIHR